ncbi:cell division protein FtsX [Orrella daihaiensis]|uniref:Cell division protein FtsX n=1 Tax=Orrella daihaiensis TaxID=2782176 RepID=A0ABY4AMA9_9BURK|nr:ABC transporter permease [Orrella daihaiensis]UOD50215.1 ABC transporter permease [Orrella daihaiensis]
MKRLLEHHRYALAVTVRRLIGQPFSFFSNVVVIALALTLPLLGASVLVSVQPLTQHVSANPAITVFMTPDASLEQAQAVAQEIRSRDDPVVLEVRLISKETAYELLRGNQAWRQALEVLPDNPLPHAVSVTIAADEAMATNADVLARQWQQLDGVAFVQLDSIWVQRIEALLRIGNIGLAMVTLIIALVVLAAVFNTVRMQALSLREEIAVARLVGATESFVRRPFLYQGGITCAIAALIAIGLASAALTPLNEALSGLSRTYDALFALHLPDALSLFLYVLAAISLGAFSARWSVTRHTRY